MVLPGSGSSFVSPRPSYVMGRGLRRRRSLRLGTSGLGSSLYVAPPLVTQKGCGVETNLSAQAQSFGTSGFGGNLCSTPPRPLYVKGRGVIGGPECAGAVSLCASGILGVSSLGVATPSLRHRGVT